MENGSAYRSLPRLRVQFPPPDSSELPDVDSAPGRRGEASQRAAKQQRVMKAQRVSRDGFIDENEQSEGQEGHDR